MNQQRNKARLERRQNRSNKKNSVNGKIISESSKESVKQPVEIVTCEESVHENSENNDKVENVGVDEPEIRVMDQVNQSQENIFIEEKEIQDNSAEIDPYQQFIKDILLRPSTTEPLIKDQEVQVNTDSFVPSVMINLKSNEQLSTVTGLESFQVLDTIVEIVKEVCGDKFEHYNMIMRTRERVIMTYVKLKQNISWSFLAVLFNCYSATHCQRIVHEMIKILSKCLKTAIPWPSKEEISRNLPECFKDFENVRVVLDCTEIFIQHPANLCCQVLTYSHYKSSNTIKIMTGVSPAGNITYVSKAYGGRATDSHIFQQSDLIKLLEHHDSVMVDRGFLIDEVCELNQWKCIRPPFLKEKKQFTKEESLITAKIATARVHVERSNQRIKTFKILGSVMPATLVPLAEEIFIVICGTINMSAPIISDDKFMNSK